MTCTESQDLMVEALYDELDSAAAAAFQEHLVGCAACRSVHSGMKQTLGVMDLRRQHEPDERFARDFWKNLSGRLSPAVARRPVWRPAAVPGWAYGLAAVLLLALGVYLGRTFFTQHAPPELAQTQAAVLQAPPDSAEEAALVYLGRTKNLLLDLVNRNGGHEAGINLEQRQRISRQLLRQSSVITASLDKPDQQLLRQLILDLEIVLLQLANLEVKPGVPAVELVRKGVDQKSILLKINLEEMRAMARRKPPEVRKSKI